MYILLICAALIIGFLAGAAFLWFKIVSAFRR